MSDDKGFKFKSKDTEILKDTGVAKEIMKIVIEGLLLECGLDSRGRDGREGCWK